MKNRWWRGLDFFSVLLLLSNVACDSPVSGVGEKLLLLKIIQRSGQYFGRVHLSGHLNYLSTISYSPSYSSPQPHHNQPNKRRWTRYKLNPTHIKPTQLLSLPSLAIPSTTTPKNEDEPATNQVPPITGLNLTAANHDVSRSLKTK